MKIGDLALTPNGDIVIIIKRRGTSKFNVRYDFVYVTGNWIGEIREHAGRRYLKWLNKKNKKKLDKLLLPR